MEEQNQKKFVTPILTEKRYANICQKIRNILEGDVDKTEKILKALCDETKFDPDIKKYTVEEGKK
jgi:hypothetical protein